MFIWGRVERLGSVFLGILGEVNGWVVRKVFTSDLGLCSVKESLSVRVVHSLSREIAGVGNKFWLVLVYSQIFGDGLSIFKLGQKNPQSHRKKRSV